MAVTAVLLGNGSYGSCQFAIFKRVPPSLPLCARKCMKPNGYIRAGAEEGRDQTRPAGTR
jgi:hypothetical protein